MSYDITIGDLDINYTSNVAPMWDLAMPLLNLRDMDGLRGETCLEHLEEGISRMARHRFEYEDMNPANGWGSYGGALAVLIQLRDACERFPRERMSVHR